MKINWAAVIQGAIVSWPPVAAGFWVSWRKTRQHVTDTVNRAALAQTQDIEQIAEKHARKAAAGEERSG